MNNPWYRGWRRGGDRWTFLLQVWVETVWLAVWRHDCTGPQVIWSMRKSRWKIFYWWGTVCVILWISLRKQQFGIVGLVTGDLMQSHKRRVKNSTIGVLFSFVVACRWWAKMQILWFQMEMEFQFCVHELKPIRKVGQLCKLCAGSAGPILQLI